LLQLVGDAEIPHRRRDQHAICQRKGTADRQKQKQNAANLLALVQIPLALYRKSVLLVENDFRPK
jgi:hypothetical protein